MRCLFHNAAAGGGQSACELGQVREKAAVADTLWVAASVSLYLVSLLLDILWRISFLHSVKMAFLVSLII